jgi:hypothetical protein
MMTPLCVLADQFQTDKGGLSTIYGGCPGDTCHTYTEAYYKMFNDRRHDVKRVLEIGVNAGSSLRMWESFFPNAEIIGLDILPHVLFNTGRIRCIQADQSSLGSLHAAMMSAGPGAFDLMIDDGSHELHHQIISMVTLLPFLAKDGVYVIEDVGGLHCNPRPITDHIPSGYVAELIECPDGQGKAHCPACGGPELLIAIRRVAS